MKLEEYKKWLIEQFSLKREASTILAKSDSLKSTDGSPISNIRIIKELMAQQYNQGFADAMEVATVFIEKCDPGPNGNPVLKEAST